MPTLFDRVKETCAAPGTGAVTLLGAVTGFQRFGTVLSNGATTYYVIADQFGTKWEVGTATWNTGHTLTRTAGNVLAGSSGAGTLVDFASGVQEVFIDFIAGGVWPVANGGTGVAELSTFLNTLLTAASSAGMLYRTSNTLAIRHPSGNDIATFSFDTLVNILNLGSAGSLRTRYMGNSTQSVRFDLNTAGIARIENAAGGKATFAGSAQTPAQITANQNNYELQKAYLWRLSSDASRNITGIRFSDFVFADTQFHRLVNVGAQNIVLVNESGLSDAQNRFLTNTGADITLGANEIAELVYDETSARWRVWKV